MRRFILILRSNWLSATGAILTTLSFMAFVTTFVYLAMYGSKHGPYAGLFAFVLLPGLFLLGIAIIPLGLWIYRKQFQARMELVTQKPFHLIRVIAVLTVINLAVLGTGGHEAVHYMDSQQFCGMVCHTVMSPTYETHVDSVHSKLACVECHIGSGVTAFAKAKISGLRQVAAVLFDTYERPIPAPISHRFEVGTTCGNCHWPQRMHAEKLVVRQHFGDDDAVTPATNVLMLKVGGTRPDGTSTGAHWHADPNHVVSYVAADPQRAKIPWMKSVDAAGKERVFTAEDVDAKKPPAGEMRTMDCIDCHNQPAHSFQEAEAAVDAAIASGSISRKLPGIRKVALATLRKEWSRGSAKESIKKDLEQAYGAEGTPAEARAELAATSESVARIWLRNIYPDMKITWGTYPNYSGHKGCLRCHDGNHTDDAGEAVTADCAACHTVVADKVLAPPILKDLGLQKK